MQRSSRWRWHDDANIMGLLVRHTTTSRDVEEVLLLSMSSLRCVFWAVESHELKVCSPLISD